MSLTRLPPPPPGDPVFEPHIALDPADPRRATVVAMFPSKGQLGKGTWCWRTADGGDTWAAGRLPQAVFDGEGAADPLVAYLPDGAIVVVSMNLPAQYVELLNAEAESTSRWTAMTAEERLQQWAGEVQESTWPTGDMICIARSEDHGETWATTLVPDSGGGDKTAIAVDRGSESPYRGNVYVAWVDGGAGQLAFARSVDRGRTAERSIRVGGRNGFAPGQIAVAPDGTVHLVWTSVFWTPPASEHPQAATAIFHARSTDGGATFGEPAVVAEHGDVAGVASLSVAAATDGSLLAVWTEADEPARERGAQVRNTTRFIHSRDGTSWTAPALLVEVPAGRSQGLPAVAASDDGWHVLLYEADASNLAVLVYSSPRDGRPFRVSHELATRRLGADELYLHGTYQLRLAVNDLAMPGDYVGLAAAGSTLAAAIVLPDTDDRRSRPTAYAALFAAAV
jgi:hypothetical protein